MPENTILEPLIVATDVDLGALGEPRKAEYEGKALREAKKVYLDQYFRQKGEKYVLSEGIRKMVHFVYHDITNGTIPREDVFSNYHLVLCRNVIIYLKREIAGRVFRTASRSLFP
ncbi:MAG: CheR family methyltransferase [Atribacterota bacterium]